MVYASHMPFFSYHHITSVNEVPVSIRNHFVYGTYTSNAYKQSKLFKCDFISNFYFKHMPGISQVYAITWHMPGISQAYAMSKLSGDSRCLPARVTRGGRPP